MHHKVQWPSRRGQRHRGTCNPFLYWVSVVNLGICMTKLTCNGTEEIRASSGLLDHSLDWESDKWRRTAIRNAHTVVGWLLGSSDFRVQLVVASLQELEAHCPVNHQPRKDSRSRQWQLRMRNLEELCESFKVSVTSKHGGGITYLTPNSKVQLLRLLLVAIPGPASAE